MSKLISLSDAITKYVNDGDTVYAAGFTHLIPFAAGHEIIRQHKRGPRAGARDPGFDLRPNGRGRMRA